MAICHVCGVVLGVSVFYLDGNGPGKVQSLMGAAYDRQKTMRINIFYL